MKPKPRIFRCDCNDPYHSLRIDPEFISDDEFPYLWISVVNRPLSLLRRLKMIWRILRNDEDMLSGIYLHRDELQDFVTYISSLAPVMNGENIATTTGDSSQHATAWGSTGSTA